MKITDTPSIERLKERLAELLFEHGPMCGRENCLHTAAEIAPILIERLAALETLTPSAGEVERIEDAAREIDDAYSAADQEPCRCNVDELSCPHCNAWDRARKRTHEILAGLTASPPPQRQWSPHLAYSGERMGLGELRDPLEQPDIEGRAREMLARECEASDASWTPLAEALRSGDFYQNDGVHVSMAIRAACQTAAPNVERLHAAIDLLNTLTGHADRDVWKPADEARSLVIAALSLPTTEIRREALEEAAKVADDFARYATEKGRPERASLASLIAADIRTLPDREAIRSLAKEDGRP